MKNIVKEPKTLPAIICIVLLASLLAACSSNAGASGPTSNATTILPAASPTSATTNKTGTSSSTPVTNVTNTGSSTPKNPPTPIKVIRMVNQVGWAITKNAIIRTTDYGNTWQDVTPTTALGADASGDFVDGNNAWVAYTYGGNTIHIDHTSDGGQSWQKYTTTEPSPAVLDPPHFLNNQEGWLEVSINGGPGAGQEMVDILHSLDGGQTWQRVNRPPNDGLKNGISFKDSQNGWATGNDASNGAWLYVTHNGGQSWQQQTLPNLPGAGSAAAFYKTTPPVFFGNYGELPVYIYNAGPNSQGMLLYKTNDGGQTWTTDFPTNHAALDQGYPDGLYILNRNYAWTNDSQDGTFRMTDSAGLVWINEATVNLVHGISFIDTANGFALGQTRLLRTTDGGQHWHVQNYTIQ